MRNDWKEQIISLTIMDEDQKKGEANSTSINK